MELRSLILAQDILHHHLFRSEIDVIRVMEHTEKANIDTNPASPTYGQVTSVTMTSIGENYPIDASKTTVNGKFPEVFIDDIIIEDPGSNYQEGDSISDDIRPVIETNPESPNRGRIVAIEIVNQIPYNRFPKMRVKSETGFGAVIRPIMSTIKTQITPEEVVENGAVRRDTAAVRDIQGREVKQIFKVVQCVGTYPAMTITPLTPLKPIIQDVEEVPETPTPEINVPDTTTTSQTDTSVDTSTPTTDTSSQQATDRVTLLLLLVLLVVAGLEDQVGLRILIMSQKESRQLEILEVNLFETGAEEQSNASPAAYIMESQTEDKLKYSQSFHEGSGLARVSADKTLQVESGARCDNNEAGFNLTVHNGNTLITNMNGDISIQGKRVTIGAHDELVLQAPKVRNRLSRW